MKRIITLGLTCIALIGISSCGKSGCTNSTAPNYNSSATKDDGSCTDLTASIVGTYTGIVEDSTIGGGSPTINDSAQQIIVTKTDDSHVQISGTGGSFPTITSTVSLATSGSGYWLTVSAQTSGGISITPYLYPYTTASGGTVSGVYTSATRSLGVSVIGNGTDIIAFVGTH